MCSIGHAYAYTLCMYNVVSQFIFSFHNFQKPHPLASSKLLQYLKTKEGKKIDYTHGLLYVMSSTSIAIVFFSMCMLHCIIIITSTYSNMGNVSL